MLIVVPNGQKPITGDETFINHTMSIKPTRHLEIDNTYINDGRIFFVKVSYLFRR